MKVKAWAAESMTTRCTSFFCTCFTNSLKATCRHGGACCGYGWLVGLVVAGQVGKGWTGASSVRCAGGHACMQVLRWAGGATRMHGAVTARQRAAGRRRGAACLNRDGLHLAQRRAAAGHGPEAHDEKEHGAVEHCREERRNLLPVVRRSEWEGGGEARPGDGKGEQEMALRREQDQPGWAALRGSMRGWQGSKKCCCIALLPRSLLLAARTHVSVAAAVP